VYIRFCAEYCRRIRDGVDSVPLMVFRIKGISSTFSSSSASMIRINPVAYPSKCCAPSRSRPPTHGGGQFGKRLRDFHVRFGGAGIQQRSADRQEDGHWPGSAADVPPSFLTIMQTESWGSGGRIRPVSGAVLTQQLRMRTEGCPGRRVVGRFFDAASTDRRRIRLAQANVGVPACFLRPLVRKTLDFHYLMSY